jgi:hypothetical protein
MASLCELRIHRYLSPAAETDFDIYYVASQMVRAGNNAHLYDGIGSDAFYQIRSMDDNLSFAQVAHQDGLPHIFYYTYPPLLADSLLPLTSFSIERAALLWRIVSLAAVILSCACIAQLLGYSLFSMPGLAVLAGMFCFAPLWQGLHYGQITMVLLLLWCAGILFYVRGSVRASALILAAGVLLKLTPLIVIVPILLWRDWRWLRWFVIGIAAGGLAICCINSPATVTWYLFHAVPHMSAGLADIENKTVPSAVGLLCGIRGQVTSHPIALLGKLLSFGLLAAAALLTFRSRQDVAAQRQASVLAAFALLSLCTAPIAWLDTYVIGGILLALLWKQAFHSNVSALHLVSLAAATALMGASAGHSAIYWRLENSTLFQVAPVAAALSLIFFVLAFDVVPVSSPRQSA